MADNKKLAVAIGVFDGLHKGHVKVIEKAVERSNSNLASAVITFSGKVKSNDGYLLSEEQKKEKIYSLGIDEIITLDFDEIKDFSPSHFVNDVLKYMLNVKYVACGYNFRFGRNACGDAQTLKKLCNAAGIEVEIIDAEKISSTNISSTTIREYLKNGKIHEANDMLGYDFAITHKVTEGDKRGSSMGIPTINLCFEDGEIVPRRGVYISKVIYDGVEHKAVTNIGIRPTVPLEKPNVESFIIDCNADLYGKTVSVVPIKFLRGEKKFESLTELKSRMELDINQAKLYFEHNG